MAETQNAFETRCREILQAEMSQAADSKDVAGICTAYVRSAYRILAEFPNMSAQEKRIHYACLRDEIERLKAQAGQDCSKVLGEIQRILG